MAEIIASERVYQTRGRKKRACDVRAAGSRTLTVRARVREGEAGAAADLHVAKKNRRRSVFPAHAAFHKRAATIAPFLGHRVAAPPEGERPATVVDRRRCSYLWCPKWFASKSRACS